MFTHLFEDSKMGQPQVIGHYDGHLLNSIQAKLDVKILLSNVSLAFGLSVNIYTWISFQKNLFLS